MRALLLLVGICKVFASEDSPSVVVVGAGSAGVAAASRLMQNGIGDVTILEAEGRVGGRTYSTKMGEYMIDLGGQWVHGEKGNVVYELVWPMGLLSHVKGPEDEPAESSTPASLDPKSPTEFSRNTLIPDYMRFFESSGEELSSNLVKDITAYAFELTDDWPDVDKLQSESLGDYFDVKYTEFFNNRTDVPENLKQPLMNLVHRFEMASQAAEDLHQVSAKGARDYLEEGNTVINWKERTYGMILEILMKKYPNPEEELPIMNKTLPHQKVSKIEYGNDGPVTVRTSGGKTYTADYVIFTPSLGVLKMNHKSIFEPNLPPNKIDAIETIGFGHVGKIYLLYDNPWWSSDNNFFYTSLLWTEDDAKEIASDPERRWMLSVYSLIRIEWKPKLLCLWLSGPNIKEMELLPEDLMKNQTLWLLNKFLGKNYNLTEPTEMMRTSWNSNDNFLGTYSFPSISAEKHNVSVLDLVEPVMLGDEKKPTVMFAGEATAERYGTVHGAIESGWREADRIINYEKAMKAAKDVK